MKALPICSVPPAMRKDELVPFSRIAPKLATIVPVSTALPKLTAPCEIWLRVPVRVMVVAAAATICAEPAVPVMLERVPITLSTVPDDRNVAELEIVTAPLPSAASLDASSVPPVIFIPPAKELVAFNSSSPAPDLVRFPAPDTGRSNRAVDPDVTTLTSRFDASVILRPAALLKVVGEVVAKVVMLSCALDAPLSKIRSPMSVPESVSDPRIVMPVVPVILMFMKPTRMSEKSGIPIITVPPELVANEKSAVDPAAAGTPPDQLAGSVQVPFPIAIQLGMVAPSPRSILSGATQNRSAIGTICALSVKVRGVNQSIMVQRQTPQQQKRRKP